MNTTSQQRGIQLDIALLFFIVLMVVTTIFVSLGPNSFFFDLLCFLVTLLLIVITYFVNIVSGLIFDLLFIFAQLIYVIYQYVYQNQFSYAMIYWLIIPTLFCLTIHFITIRLRRIEKENLELRRSTTQVNALDVDTQLRTLNMFDDDFLVLSKAATHYHIPLNIMVIRVRYWEGLKSMMTVEQIQELVYAVSQTITDYYKADNFKYIIDHSTPTWGVLTFIETSELKIIRSTIKENFNSTVRVSPTLANLNLELVISTAEFTDEMSSSTDLLAEGIRELQYDV